MSKSLYYIIYITKTSTNTQNILYNKRNDVRRVMLVYLFKGSPNIHFNRLRTSSRMCTCCICEK